MGVALKICPWSQIFLGCARADLDLIMNATNNLNSDLELTGYNGGETTGGGGNGTGHFS